MINEKQFQDILKELLKIQDCETAENLLEAVLEKLKFLFNEKEYAKVVLLFHNNICYPKDSFYVFEVAYSLAENEAFIDEAEIVYSNLLKSDPKNVAVLNNLAIIKENKNKIEEAHGLIKLSHELEPHNELYTRNYTRILPKYEDIIKYNDNYKSSLAGLQKENDFVITKLNAFIINVMNDSTFKSGRIPIPAWKFTELMNTDKQKAESLKEQWLKKYYIRNTEDRGEHNELIYELNPFLKQEIEKINNRKLNVKWIEGIEVDPIVRTARGLN